MIRNIKSLKILKENWMQSEGDPFSLIFFFFKKKKIPVVYEQVQFGTYPEEDSLNGERSAKSGK
jgi:hypothetical protein